MILHLDCYFCFVSADLVFPVCLGQRLKGVLAATPRNLFIPDLSQEWLLQNAALIGVRGRKRWRPCHMKVVNFCLSRECKQSCVLFVEFMPQSTLSCCEAMFRILNERNLSRVYWSCDQESHQLGVKRVEEYQSMGICQWSRSLVTCNESAWRGYLPSLCCFHHHPRSPSLCAYAAVLYSVSFTLRRMINVINLWTFATSLKLQ